MHCEASTCISRSNAWPILAWISLPIIAFATVAFAKDVPELVVVLALVVYSLLPGRCKFMEFAGNKYQHLLAFVASLQNSRLLLFIILCISLLGAIICELPEVGLPLSSAIGYLMLNSIGRFHKTSRPKTLQFKQKMFAEMPKGSAAPPRSPPVQVPRQQAPRQVASPSLAATRHKPTHGSVELCSLDCAAVQKLPQALMATSRDRSAAEARNIDAVATLRPKNDLDAEIEELVCSGLPNSSDDDVVRQLVCMVRKSVLHIVPEAKVVGSAVGNLKLVEAQGVKPEVDIVVMVSLDVLGERLKDFYMKGPQHNQKNFATLHPDLLVKTATRVFSERLPSLRFWRSQFTGPDPKIVLLAPASLGICSYPLRVNLCINNPYALRLKSVLSNCDAHSRGLIVLVTHWADVRGLANTAKGHLSPYAYSLLALRFLRHGCEADPFGKSAIEVFEDFVNFYSAWFEREDGVMICFSSENDDAPVGENRLKNENALEGMPYIEDPFATSDNVAATVTAKGVARLKEELARASCILKGGITTLATLMERWLPPSAAAKSKE